MEIQEDPLAILVVKNIPFPTYRRAILLHIQQIYSNKMFP